MEFSEATLALCKLLFILGAMAVCLRLRLALWVTIFAASLLLALLCGVALPQWPEIAFKALFQKDFLALGLMLFLILALSGVQEATGQSNRLVQGVERYLRWPRIRLIIFPAIVGLLPMPGGALFSCPMLKAAAEGMNLGEQRKTLINYWFRHIWEVAWPLYPGFVLVCSLLGITAGQLMRYTFPLVIMSFLTGWFFYIRDLARSDLLKKSTTCALPEENTLSPEAATQLTTDCNDRNAASEGITLLSLLREALPLLITLFGAGVFSLFFDTFLPNLPGQFSFIASLACAVGTALFQGRGKRTQTLWSIAFSRNAIRIFLLVTAIFVFKQTISSSNLVTALSHFGNSTALICIAFIVVPLISGLLTGIMVGFVGVCFPILLGVLEHSPMKEHLLPFVILAMVTGNCGQMLSPLHVCLVVSCEYFKVNMTEIWRHLPAPAVIQAVCGIIWVLVLLAFGAEF